MKIQAWKKVAAVVVAVAMAITGILYFTSDTGKENPRSNIDPAFAEHIASFTTGIVQSGSHLTIVLNEDAIDSTQIGQEPEARLFDFTPALKGRAVWLDKRTVEFQPETRMVSGKVYAVKFFLSRLKDELPETLRTLEYTFQVMPQNFEVVLLNTKPYVKTDFKKEKIEGKLQTADYAAALTVEKTMEASQAGRALKLTWTHDEDGRQHHFVVEDVSRETAPGKVNIQVNGDHLGIDRQQDLEVDIPALNDFKLVNVRVVQSPTQHVILQFSDPLKDNQNLNGLVRLSDLPALDFDIHDNEVWVYPPVRQNGKRTLSIANGIRNVLDKRLAKSVAEEVVFEQVKPAVRFTGKGSILPGTEGLVLPFEAVNLKAVDIQITKIHESNVLQFFQVNSLETHQELRRVGNRILRKKIQLDNHGITDPGKWNRYTLDITRLIQTEPGAIYEVKLGFRHAYSTYGCQSSIGQPETHTVFESLEEPDDSFQGEWSYDYYDDYYYGEGFDWRQRDNPCNASYYTPDKFVIKNILASDLGATVKHGGDGATLAFITDLKTARPLSGVEITLYSYQMQVIGSGVTDGEGRVSVTTRESPFALVAKKGSQRGYLRLVNGEALMVSNFDVSGQVVQKGLKGFIYGERGVWRPGDSLFVTFIMEDKRALLPENHPVVFELSNPQGQVMQRMVRAASENGFYKFATATSADAPTGNWTGRVKVGGTEFTQTLRIETVKPNRLKINLDLGSGKLTSDDLNGILEVKWLHGAPGRNLKAEFDVLLQRKATEFSAFPDYNFDDPSREFQGETQSIFEGRTDSEGKALISSRLERSGAPSGFLNAVFRGKVFEESGNFSIDRFSIPYYPYESFVGMRVPEGERYSGILYTDKPHRIALATVDNEGKGISRQGIEVNLFKLDWRWWWDNSSERLANYVEGNYSTLVKSGAVNTSDGKGEWTFSLGAAEYGRYFLRVCDPVSGHCAGKVIYVDEPGWYSRARGEDARGGANLLSFSTDKTTYNIGEKMNLIIPGSAQGRALVSIENGSKVLQTYWVETQQGDTRFAVDVTREMAPNVYVHVSLLQPHNQTENDLPIRLYGVTGVQVEDPLTHLDPVISMPEVLVPGEAVTIRVSERSDRKMTYTLAVVDEGLLDLTRFRTPDAWKTFYAREALGVRTWDLYDQVMGAFGANLERFISIGGDDALATAELDPLANRFKPVVKFFGPFTMNGGTQEIAFVVPQYIGSVKTMLVAGNDGAYGKAEHVSAVRKPLMVLATLPRVLGPGEIATLPVTLFTGEKNLSNVSVEVNVSGPLAIKGDKRKSLSLTKDADATIDFELAIKDETGVATVEVIATSGNLRSSDVIEIQVRNPNLPVTRVTEFFLDDQKRWTTTLTPFGMNGTNAALLEVSGLPPINLASRMRYLLQYPHGCIEQITSSVFPQLYLSHFKNLTDAEQDVIQKNVKAGIEQLKAFAQPDGGFVYWPGLSESSDSWGTSYAGHFLIEAEARGYYVPADMIQRWRDFQRTKAVAWRRSSAYANADLLQSYRLYTLALGGAPELGAMNRLREEDDIAPSAAWMLASAFAVAGQREAARKLVQDLPLAIKPYREMGFTYGSALRDQALILETLVLLDDNERAFEVLKEISTALGDAGYWMSTQETAMCLKAVSEFASDYKRADLNFTYQVGKNKTVSASTGLPYAQIEIPVTGLNSQQVEVVNKGDGPLFTRLIISGTPARGEEVDEANELEMTVRYTDINGNAIDIARMEQGTEFVVEVTVGHPGVRGAYENLALSQVFPPGWEINNLRLDEAEESLQTSPFRYQDIRDDRVFTYFSLAPREEKTFRLLVTATYSGTFYLPAVSCEAMYDGSVHARKKGQSVTVEKSQSR